MQELCPDLSKAINFVYTPSGLSCKDLLQEVQNKEYGAYTFVCNGKMVKFRVAKITPKKVGQFVAFWKRDSSGYPIPYASEDSFDLLIVSVRRGGCFGQFIFSKELLTKKGYVSIAGNGGKRAMRIYPPWDTPDNKLALKNQSWQLPYFFEIVPDVNSAILKKLFGT